MRYWLKEIYIDNTLFKGLRLTDIAKEMGYSISYLCRIKHGEKIANETMYRKIQKAVIKLRNENSRNDRRTAHSLSQKVSQRGV